MLTRILIFLCEVSPAARRALWRWWYQRWAREVTSGDWTFMNYGFDWPAGETPPALQPEDEPDRYCAQLYLRVAAPGELEGKEVLEVGSGRGGGAALVHRYLETERMTAVDYSAEAVQFCQRHHKVSGLIFQEGDAEKLPFPDASFDAVLNVESSHCYGSMETFLREVTRVLRPGGSFLLADLREAADMVRLEEQLARNPGLELRAKEDLTPGVVAALTRDHARKQKMISGLIPPAHNKMFAEFAGLEGTKIHRGLLSGTLQYYRWEFFKPGAEAPADFLDDSTARSATNNV